MLVFLALELGTVKYGTERPTNGQSHIAACQDCSAINRPNIKLSERRISISFHYSELTLDIDLMYVTE